MRPFNRIRSLAAGSVLVAGVVCSPGRIPAAESPRYTIKTTGTAFPVPYEKYGSFHGRGTKNYKYRITDRKGLAKSIGYGLYPDVASLESDPSYVRWLRKRLLDVNPWDYVNTPNPQDEYYVWSRTKRVGPGTKLFFMGDALTRSGHYQAALKAYYAVLVHFPSEPCWSADQSFVWYVARAALDRIEYVTKHHPEIGYRLRGAVYETINGDDTDLNNDEFIVDPGRWEKVDPPPAADVSAMKIVNRRGYGKVTAVQFENKHWQLRVDGKPFIVRGVTYLPTAVGSHVSGGVGNRWMKEDADENGFPDSPYDAWVDENNNGHQDDDEPSVGDFDLMRRMGVNAVRLYRNVDEREYQPNEFNKELLREMHRRYGISVIMGDFLGAYTVGSGALWEDGTDYTDPVQLENMKRILRDFVKDHRGEPYVLMWLLGNENLMPADYSGVNATRTKASLQVEAYLKFLNEMAEMIHRLDPDHPVAVGNWELQNIADYAAHAPAIDIFGVNSYRGSFGFGDLWRNARENFDRPVLITEYGCDAFDSRTNQEDEVNQAIYHEEAWRDIALRFAGGTEEGNAIGGVIFEWLDEWWKSMAGAWDLHDTANDAAMAFPDGWSSEEWMGIVSQGNGLESPFLRRPRLAYYVYRDRLWKPYR